MNDSQTQLQKIAEKLSKIPGDNSALLGNITDILKYVEMLEEVDTQGVIPTVSIGEGACPLREDQLTSQVEPKELLACSNQKIVADQVVLPNIMK